MFTQGALYSFSIFLRMLSRPSGCAMNVGKVVQRVPRFLGSCCYSITGGRQLKSGGGETKNGLLLKMEKV